MLILASKITICISVSAFASLICVPVGITSSAVGLYFCAVTAEIKKYKPIIKKKKKKHDKVMWLGKRKLRTIGTLISKEYIIHIEFVLVYDI